MTTILTTHCTAQPEGLNQVLGEPSWAWATVDVDAAEAAETCGLTPGTLPTAGWGNSEACARIWLHVDGFCIGAGWAGHGPDEAFVRELASKLDTEFEEHVHGERH